MNFTRTILNAVKYWANNKFALKEDKSDWNQNDPSAPDYVKNRTHYTYPKKVLVHTETITSGCQYLSLTEPLKEKTTYKVVFSSETEEYSFTGEFKPHSNISAGFVGHCINGSTIPNSGMDLVTEDNFKSVYAIFALDNFPVTLTITTIMDAVVQLDEKYIPATIARTEDVRAMIEEALASISHAE